MDYYTVKKLVQKVFPVCKCKQIHQKQQELAQVQLKPHRSLFLEVVNGRFVFGCYILSVSKHFLCKFHKLLVVCVYFLIYLFFYLFRKPMKHLLSEHFCSFSLSVIFFFFFTRCCSESCQKMQLRFPNLNKSLCFVFLFSCVCVKAVEDAELLEMMDACDEEDSITPLPPPNHAHLTELPASQVIKKLQRSK